MGGDYVFQNMNAGCRVENVGRGYGIGVDEKKKRRVLGFGKGLCLDGDDGW